MGVGVRVARTARAIGAAQLRENEREAGERARSAKVDEWNMSVQCEFAARAARVAWTKHCGISDTQFAVACGACM
jgi:hypothetical protein